MSEHLLTDDIKNYLDRKMNSLDLLKADKHLAACDFCFKKLRDSKFTENAVPIEFRQVSAEESAHLSYARLENYVDEKSDHIEREIVDVHLKVCPVCAAELKGLSEMRSLIDADLQKSAATPKENSIFGGIRNFLAGKYFLRFGFVAPTVLLIVLLAGIFWFFKGNKSDEIADTSSPSNIFRAQNQQNSTENLPINIQTPINGNILPNTNSATNLPASTPTPRPTETLMPPYKSEIERVLAENRLNFPHDVKDLSNQSGKLMSGGTDTIPFALSNPVGKIIQSSRPNFSWRALEGADGYVVNIYDTNFNQVATSPNIPRTSWQIDKPLSRNRIYLWQVTAIKDGKEIKSPMRPAPDARFKILDAKQTDELESLRRQYKNEHLFLGIMYAKAGLLDEAAREFQKEIAKNPNSKAARKFLQDVRRQNR